MKFLNCIGKHITSLLKPYFVDASIHVFITTTGSLMPVWGGLLLYLLFSLTIDFWGFLNGGEFYLISAGIFTPSCYQLYRNKNTINLFHSFVFLTSILLLVISAILFAGTSMLGLPIFSTEAKANFPLKLNEDFLHWSSMILLFLSVLVALISQTIENKLRSGGPDATEVSEARLENVDELSQNFDKLQEENG